MFVYRKGDVFLALLIYVDDLVLTYTHCHGFKQYLHRCFKLKDLGPLDFLGIEVVRSLKGLLLCQCKYVMNILSESGMLGAKPPSFPIEQNLKLISNSSKPIGDPPRFRQLVGRLTITRPDIIYLVHILSRFMQDPRQGHREAPMRLLHYLKSCPGQGILFPACNTLGLQVYCDSDRASCPMTRRFVTGYLLKLGNMPIS